MWVEIDNIDGQLVEGFELKYVQQILYWDYLEYVQTRDRLGEYYPLIGSIYCQQH